MNSDQATTSDNYSRAFIASLEYVSPTEQKEYTRQQKLLAKVFQHQSGLSPDWITGVHIMQKSVAELTPHQTKIFEELTANFQDSLQSRIQEFVEQFFVLSTEERSSRFNTLCDETQDFPKLIPWLNSINAVLPLQSYLDQTVVQSDEFSVTFTSDLKELLIFIIRVNLDAPQRRAIEKSRLWAHLSQEPEKWSLACKQLIKLIPEVEQADPVFSHEILNIQRLSSARMMSYSMTEMANARKSLLQSLLSKFGVQKSRTKPASKNKNQKSEAPQPINTSYFPLIFAPILIGIITSLINSSPPSAPQNSFSSKYELNLRTNPHNQPHPSPIYFPDTITDNERLNFEKRLKESLMNFKSSSALSSKPLKSPAK